MIALCYDGTGYGDDGAIWGGEILFGNAFAYHRAAHLQYLPLPGGDQAIKKPYRIAIAYLHSLGIPLDEESGSGPSIVHSENVRSFKTRWIRTSMWFRHHRWEGYSTQSLP